MEAEDVITALPQKVLLMYQAVADMVKEGWDVSKIKVSDITARAGIGKGTAYEYFSSKEEIISNALIYDVQKKREDLARIASAETGFEKKIRDVLDFVEEKFSVPQMFETLVRVGTGAYELPVEWKARCEKAQEIIGCDQLEEIADCIMEKGVQEGMITESNPRLRQLAFVAQLITFGTFLVAKNQGKETSMTVEEAKQFAYQSLVKSLS